MTIFRPRKLLTVAAFLASSYVVVNADSMIQVVSRKSDTIEDSAVQQIPSRKASVNVIIDNDDLLNMPSISFSGMDGANHVGDTAVFKKITATSRPENSGTNNKEETIWQGAIMGDRVGFATFVRGADGTLSGSFTNDDTAYVLSTMPDGSTQVEATLFKDFPPEDDDHEDLLEADSSSSEPTRRMRSSGNSLRGTAEHEVRSTTTLVDIRQAAALTGHQDGSPQQNMTVVDVLVLITNRAMCEAAGLNYGCSLTPRTRATIEGNIRVAEIQTNTALGWAGAAAEIRVVKFEHLPPHIDYFADRDSLPVIRASPNVNQWRSDVRADLVAVITGGSGCGIAYLNQPFSATHYRCLGQYTFTHELGHNMGCYHNRDNSGTQHSYAHGWQSPSSFRTLMSYPCSTTVCARIPYFSNDEYLYNGQPMGGSRNDNARQVRNNIANIANWM